MTIKPSALLEYSSINPEVWQIMVGQKLTHKVFGSGIIKEICIGNKGITDSLAVIQLDCPIESIGSGLSDIKKIGLQAFTDEIINELNVPDELVEKIELFEREKLEQVLEIERRVAERIRLKEIEQERLEKEGQERREQFNREENARTEFKLRKEKYQVLSFTEISPLSELNRILIKLDDYEAISDDDEQWLENNKLFPVLAIYYERIGNLAKAGSNWRKSDNPHRALEITQNLPSPNHYVLTMRGGAYRDIGDFEMAKECALSAIRIEPNDYHPYNLLGAIFYQQGLLEEGYQNFQKARLLGSKPSDEERDIKSAISKAGSESRETIINFLLEKDPKHYEWARYYLNKKAPKKR